MPQVNCSYHLYVVRMGGPILAPLTAHHSEIESILTRKWQKVKTFSFLTLLWLNYMFDSICLLLEPSVILRIERHIRHGVNRRDGAGPAGGQGPVLPASSVPHPDKSPRLCLIKNKAVHGLTPQTSDCVTLYSKRDCRLMKGRILRWRRDADHQERPAAPFTPG